jgi:chitinase
MDEAGLDGLDVDLVNSSSDYFATSCIPSSETTLHQKKMSIAN